VTGISVQGEAVAGCPVKYRLSTAFEHCDIERFDLHLLQHLHTGGRGCGVKGASEDGLGTSFKRETLQGPPTTLLDLQRNGRERYDPAEFGDVALVGEAGHIALDTIMPGDERSGSREANGPIWRDQSSTGEDRLRLQN